MAFQIPIFWWTLGTLCALYLIIFLKWRSFKKILKFLRIFIILSPIWYIIFAFTLLYIARYQDIKIQERAMRNPNPEWQIMKQKIDAKIDAQWDHIHAGRDYEKAGQYELAIEEYKKTIELGEAWMGHASLARLYEKMEQYKLAIQEINWLISYKPPDPKVVDEYIARKRKLEKLLEKAEATEPQNTLSNSSNPDK